MNGQPLLRVRGLEKSYRSKLGGSRLVRAVDGVSLELDRGDTLGIVGESGSGKTTLGRLVARLEEPDAGQIQFDGEDWLSVSGKRLRQRRRNLQVVFQDPKASLNPRLLAGSQIAEPLRVQGLATRREIPERVRALLEEVGLPPETAGRLPEELSGGQRQRVAIARALATRPKLLVCDEPLSALDVSVSAQIINLFLDLRENTGIASLFISHDLPAVVRLADRVAVIYLGRVVEEGPAGEVLGSPLHPFTVALAAAAPPPPGQPVGAVARLSLPEPGAATPGGCRFAPRCPIARPRCLEEDPLLAEVSAGRWAACHFPGEAAPGSR